MLTFGLSVRIALLSGHAGLLSSQEEGAKVANDEGTFCLDDLALQAIGLAIGKVLKRQRLQTKKRSGILEGQHLIFGKLVEPFRHIV